MDSLISIVVDGRSVLLHVREERKGSVSGVLFRLEFTALAAKAFRFLLGYVDFACLKNCQLQIMLPRTDCCQKGRKLVVDGLLLLYLCAHLGLFHDACLNPRPTVTIQGPCTQTMWLQVPHAMISIGFRLLKP